MASSAITQSTELAKRAIEEVSSSPIALSARKKGAIVGQSPCSSITVATIYTLCHNGRAQNAATVGRKCLADADTLVSYEFSIVV